MDRITLLKEYFMTDTSGNELDGIREHYVRVNPRLITKDKSTEFNYVMNILFPNWRILNMKGGHLFTIRDVDDSIEKRICICTQCIVNLCYLEHPSLELSVQVGNECVGKIDKKLQKESEQLLRLKKKKDKELIEQTIIKNWDDYNQIIISYHYQREKQLELEIDELVARVEKEHDEQMELRHLHNKVTQRISFLEQNSSALLLQKELFRTCIQCNKYSIVKTEPFYKTKCLSCYKTGGAIF
jgi:hypothetical protein